MHVQQCLNYLIKFVSNENNKGNKGLVEMIDQKMESFNEKMRGFSYFTDKQFLTAIPKTVKNYNYWQIAGFLNKKFDFFKIVNSKKNKIEMFSSDVEKSWQDNIKRWNDDECVEIWNGCNNYDGNDSLPSKMKEMLKSDENVSLLKEWKKIVSFKDAFYHLYDVVVN